MNTAKYEDRLSLRIASKKILRLYPSSAQAYQLFASLPACLDSYLQGDESVELIEISYGGKTSTLDVAFLRALQADLGQSDPAGSPPA